MTLLFGEVVPARLSGGDDTVRTYRMDEVIVSASRLGQAVTTASSSISVIARTDIDNANATSIAGIVSLAEGLFVKDYGGATGLKTISQRGLGTEHTVIMLNGLRFSSLQNGLADLALLPLDDVDRVEVIRGGQSAMFGADAVAGVVNIVSRPTHPGLSVRADAAVGSFGYRRYSIGGSNGTDRSIYRIGYRVERSDEDYPFRFSDGSMSEELRRKNADVRSDFVFGSLTHRMGSHLLSVLVRSYHSDRGIGGPVVSRFSSSSERQTDEDLVIQLGDEWKLGNVGLLALRSQYHRLFERYHNPAVVVGGIPLTNYFRNVEYRLHPGYSHRWSDGLSSEFGVDIAYVQAEGNSIRSDVKRTDLGSYITAQQRIRINRLSLSDLIISPAFRFDASTSPWQAFSPQFGARLIFDTFDVGFLNDISPSLRLSVSRNFRSPTFNELYFSGGGGIGNPDLSPERAVNVDVGGSLSWEFAGRHRLNLSYFVIEMADRIVWMPAGGATVKSMNLRNVTSKGFELGYRADMWHDVATLILGYSNSNSSKSSEDYPGDPTVGNQLIYIPHDNLSFSLSLRHRNDHSTLQRIEFTTRFQYVGFRYYAYDNSRFLPSFQIVDLNLSTSVMISPIVVPVKLEVNNVLNEDYQVIVSYPMPLRSYRLSIGITH